MDFGKAIEALKAGNRVARAGWNGKGMYLQLAKKAQAAFGPCPRQNEGESVHVEPHILIWTAQKNWAPWLASQGDVLAIDWTEVE